MSNMRTPGGMVVDDAVFAEKRDLAETLRNDPVKFAKVQCEARQAIELIAPTAKGVSTRIRSSKKLGGLKKTKTTRGEEVYRTVLP
jgi:hypothetical protein